MGAPFAGVCQGASCRGLPPPTRHPTASAPLPPKNPPQKTQVVLPGNLELPRFRHLLVAFGGPEGLEHCAANDKRLSQKSASPAAELFDAYLNTCPGQGSRTIRTEEAVLISMGFMQTAVARFGER